MSVELSITIFALALPLGLYLAPVVANGWFENRIAYKFVRRCFYLIATFVLLQSIAIVGNIAESTTSQYDIMNFFTIWTWFCYAMLAFVVVISLIEIVQLYRQNKEEKRLGENEQ